MTIRINVGLSRKVGQPNFGSLGASCHIDIELDPEAVQFEPDRLHAKVREAFAVCKQSVDAELARSGQANGAALNSHEPIAEPTSGRNRDHAAASNGNSGDVRSATAAQVKAIHAIAGRAGFALASELESRFGVSDPQHLSVQQASQMIDYLKFSLPLSQIPVARQGLHRGR